MYLSCEGKANKKPNPVSLKKILEREDQYLYVARRTFTNLFLARTHLDLLRAVPDLIQLSLEST